MLYISEIEILVIVPTKFVKSKFILLSPNSFIISVKLSIVLLQLKLEGYSNLDKSTELGLLIFFSFVLLGIAAEDTILTIGFFSGIFSNCCNRHIPRGVFKLSIYLGN